MSLINIKNLTFSYDGSHDPVFENVSFQIDSDWKLGLTGRNGRGKTTLLNLLMGKYEYSGTIHASEGFDYFPYEVGDMNDDTLTVIDRTVSDYEYWRLQKELSLLDVEEEVLYRPFSTLSNGERTKILLAALFLKEARFLLIDEPTNHLDMEARELVGRYLRSKKGFILVSHDRTFLDQCVDHILSINKNNIEVQKGNFSSWQYNKEIQDQFELAENEKLKKEIKGLTEAARRTAAWSDKVESTKNGLLLSGIKADKGYTGHKAAKMMKRSKNLELRQENAIEEKSKLLKNLETADDLSIKPLGYHSSRLVEAEGLSIYYDGRPAVEKVSFSIDSEDRIAIAGKNGSGKSSIMKLILGENLTFTGNLRIGSKLILSYVSQETSHLKGNLKDYAASEGIDESLFKAILRKLDFSRVQFEKDISDFSEGQKKKVLIAASLCQKAHLYIWDEPLNFIDVISRMQIEEMLLKYKPTLLFVEHDAAFYENIATKKVLLGSE
ncbi:ABC-F type ribosomal protection protein [Anoxybacterium hadale]|uniref:ABC-F type ribosomal protection protein n=1 Tax=Anoxybacterium hadale TaxID=3408580 RepID=A0ACD1AFN9_9FIRM|nr:ABC-F type ribosomal protection protein [Clostridiales bacterium]